MKDLIWAIVVLAIVQLSITAYTNLARRLDNIESNIVTITLRLTHLDRPELDLLQPRKDKK
jgi:hypothetical protein